MTLLEAKITGEAPLAVGDIVTMKWLGEYQRSWGWLSDIDSDRSTTGDLRNSLMFVVGFVYQRDREDQLLVNDVPYIMVYAPGHGLCYMTELYLKRI